ncbi:olfactory receptor 4E2-like [Discoglossus pictus]
MIKNQGTSEIDPLDNGPWSQHQRDKKLLEIRNHRRRSIPGLSTMQVHSISWSPWGAFHLRSSGLRGFNSPHKRRKAFLTYKEHRPSVIFLQEIHFMRSNPPKYLHKQYPNFYTAEKFSRMENQTLDPVLTLHGLSDIPNLSLSLFLFFSLIFLMTLTANLLILLLTVIDSHLHTPMYFFLGNLAYLDICYSSVTSPRMLYDFFLTKITINLTACITQIFFFMFLATVEGFLLTVMSYDRYTAICLPLHYVQIMHRKFCVKLTIGAWIIGFLNSLTHTLFINRLTFCGPYVIESFFCELPRVENPIQNGKT